MGGPAGCGARGVCGAAGLAGLDQFLQDVVGLGFVVEAFQHPQDVPVGVAQLEEAFHSAMLVVHAATGFSDACVCVSALGS